MDHNMSSPEFERERETGVGRGGFSRSLCLRCTPLGSRQHPVTRRADELKSTAYRGRRARSRDVDKSQKYLKVTESFHRLLFLE